ncbi:MAG: phytoene desaturase family protein [Myxococcota bacterium]
MGETRAIVIGGGHNGLVCACYLARGGHSVTLLERRERLGGACITEELWPGYRVSRAAYVLSLFRPRIVRELELARHGLQLLPRTPASFTPLPDGRSLVLGSELEANVAEIRRFSEHDAQVYPAYEALLERIASAVEPTLDAPPPELPIRRPRDLASWWLGLRGALRLGSDFPRALRLLLGPARELLEEHFDSEPLRSTLATDAVIGAFAGPSSPGTGALLFHHVMGSLGGRRGVWAYVRGGMGGLTTALERAARALGVSIRPDAAVRLLRSDGPAVTGVVLESGEELDADVVASSLDPARTFGALDEGAELPEGFHRALAGIDYRSPVLKLNLALRTLPRFRADERDEQVLGGTIHLGPLDLDGLERAFEDARRDRGSERPVIELTIPSVLDPTLAPPGRHVASIFAQYAPALPTNDPRWPAIRDRMRDRILATVDELAPGFSSSIEALELLAPPDLEREFGLTGGNIFQGAMTPDRMLFLRPVAGWSRYRTPLRGLYLCGAAAHPGGGVMGAPGRNAALEILHRPRR